MFYLSEYYVTSFLNKYISFVISYSKFLFSYLEYFHVHIAKFVAIVIAEVNIESNICLFTSMKILMIIK